MQVNVSCSNVYLNEHEEVFHSIESEEEGINEIMKRCSDVAFKQIAPELKKALVEESDKKIDLLASIVTAPCKESVTAKCPTMISVIVNPAIESSVKNTSKKVANCAIDKCIDQTEKSIPVVIDYSHKSTQSFFGCFSNLFSSPSVASEKIKENI